MTTTVNTQYKKRDYDCTNIAIVIEPEGRLDPRINWELASASVPMPSNLTIWGYL